MSDLGTAEREELEAEIRAHAEAGRFEAAITQALEAYGGEVLGFIHAMMPSAADADEQFSALCEHAWRGLPEFRFEASFRTWIYTIARNLVRDYHRAGARRARRFVPDGGASVISQIAERVRSTTAVHLKTETKSRLQAIRDALDPDDRTLLVLRLDRGMSWNEIAHVLAGDAKPDGDPRRASARLRKRFERVKARVVELMRAESE